MLTVDPDDMLWSAILGDCNPELMFIIFLPYWIFLHISAPIVVSTMSTYVTHFYFNAIRIL